MMEKTDAKKIANELLKAAYDSGKAESFEINRILEGINKYVRKKALDLLKPYAETFGLSGMILDRIEINSVGRDFYKKGGFSGYGKRTEEWDMAIEKLRLEIEALKENNKLIRPTFRISQTSLIISIISVLIALLSFLCSS